MFNGLKKRVKSLEEFLGLSYDEDGKFSCHGELRGSILSDDDKRIARLEKLNGIDRWGEPLKK